jgi:predicted GNAT family acetyltransferase
MKVVRHKGAREFLDRAGAWLDRAEIENNLVFGIASYFASHVGEPQTQPYFLTIEDQGTIAGTALMTPPRRLLISAMPDDAVIELADYLLSVSAPVPGVVGITSNAERFVNYWTGRTRQTCRIKRTDRLYACTAVLPLTYSPGRLRPATADDQILLSEWCVQFCLDAGIDDEITFFKARLPHKIADGSLFVWETDTVASMAGFERERPRGVAISWVFTPSHLRSLGYATSCVAALTQYMFDAGKQFCCLYADLANLTSSSIYRKIGYREICDVQHWVIE